MACEFPIAVKAKLMLTAIHCLLYFTSLHNRFKFRFPGLAGKWKKPQQKGLETVGAIFLWFGCLSKCLANSIKALNHTHTHLHFYNDCGP